MKNTMELSNGLVCSRDELDMLMQVVCTCWFSFLEFVYISVRFNNKYSVSSQSFIMHFD